MFKVMIDFPVDLDMGWTFNSQEEAEAYLKEKGFYIEHGFQPTMWCFGCLLHAHIEPITTVEA